MPASTATSTPGASNALDQSVRDPHTPSRRTQILEAARTLFAEDGYDATSMADIARRVGVVEGAVYRHVPSKRDLLHQVIASFYEPLIDSATTAIASIDSPRERVAVLIRRQLQAFTDDRLLCRLLISEARSFDDYYDSEPAALSRRYTALFMDAFADGVQAGEFRSDIPAAVARDIVYGSIEHLAWSSLSGHGALDVETTTSQLMAVIDSGLCDVHANASSNDTGNDDTSGDTTSSDTSGNRTDELLDRLTAVTERLEATAALTERADPPDPTRLSDRPSVNET